MSLDSESGRAQYRKFLAKIANLLQRNVRFPSFRAATNMQGPPASAPRAAAATLLPGRVRSFGRQWASYTISIIELLFPQSSHGGQIVSGRHTLRLRPTGA